MRLFTTVFNVSGAFFAFVIGGWVAARIAGVRRAEPAAAVALLLGLVGSAVGGWMASGEPMRVSYYRRRDRVVDDAPRRVA